MHTNHSASDTPSAVTAELSGSLNVEDMTMRLSFRARKIHSNPNLHPDDFIPDTIAAVNSDADLPEIRKYRKYVKAARMEPLQIKQVHANKLDGII